MRVDLAGVPLRTPVIAASGTFGYGVEFEDIVVLDRIGGFITKGLSYLPMPGNAAPRLIETTGGMINAIGLQNVGVDAFVTTKLNAFSKRPGCALIANVFGYEVADYVAVVEVLNRAEGIAAYEINASCPNTKHGGMVFGADPVLLADLVSRVKKASHRPIFIKLSPNVTSIAAMAKVAEESGADALSLVNTFLSLSIDIRTRRPRIANVTGGLSGPAIKPILLRLVWQCARAVNIPVIGCGGITTTEDAIEYLLAGATAVQVGTTSFVQPTAMIDIIDGLARFCDRREIARVADLTGALRHEEADEPDLAWIDPPP
jgi:dihydroorotate dehydrogenase (NAD+) catalytic subunit